MLRFSSRLSSISFLERNSKNKLKKLGQATRIGACPNCIYRLIHVTMQRYSKHEMTHPINQGIKQQASAKFHPIVCCYGLNFSLENHFVWLVKYDFKA